RADPADPVARELGEPEVAVRPARDLPRLAIGVREGELRDRAGGGGDAADPSAGLLGEPDVAVRAGGDPERSAAGVGQRVLGDHTLRRDPAHLVAGTGNRPPLAEPEVP